MLAGSATSIPPPHRAPGQRQHLPPPAVLANMAATIDHLSGGRLVLGLGAGWQQNEHRAYGIEYSDIPGRLARLDEACAVLRSL